MFLRTPMQHVSYPATAVFLRTLAGFRDAFAILSVLALSLCNVPAHAANALAGNPSPYLAMHGQDPVDWRLWGSEALAEARRENRPLFVSSGYFACHWCHVMQRETYRNPQIAARLNRDFIPVKLDRELHPALDAYLIGFVERTAGQAGWPLNVFLTPEGYPLVGLTYAPRDRFQALLQKVARVWSRDRENLVELARRGAEERARDHGVSPALDAASIPAAELAERLRRQSLLNADELSGGFGRQTRFPMAPNLLALLELQARLPDKELAAFLRLTLDDMSRKGLRDHLRGGFFRYTVDPDWQTPHFGKMLYTQALLIPLFLRAAEVLEEPAYRDVARDTLTFLLEAMKGRDGAFIASLSAVDAAGVEGGYYLWRPEDLESLLELDERRLLALVWGVAGPPRHEQGYLAMGERDPTAAAAELGLSPQAGGRLLASARSKLVSASSGRSLPRDDKQLAGWNGLVLSALAAGLVAFEDESYRTAGSALSDFLRERLWDGEELHRAVSDLGWIGEATLEDYAFVAKGLRDWGIAVGSQTDVALSRRLVGLAWERFYGKGGWQLSAEPLLPLVPAEPVFSDSPLPSPASVLMDLTLTVDERTLLEKVHQALDLGRAPVAQNPFVFASQALLYLEHPSGL
jgi:uncharacterized protein YyaL (SSP411 family)